MTIAERNKKLKHLITCMKCEVSGKCCDDNCPTQYDAGNMGEIIENLEAISKALEQESKWIPVSERLPEKRGFYIVSTTDCITIMEFINGWISENIGVCNNYVIAWMPLPKPYEAEK